MKKRLPENLVPELPLWSKYILMTITPEPLRESVLGDFEESWRRETMNKAGISASLMLILMIARSLLPLLFLRYQFSKRHKMTLYQRFATASRPAAWLGLVCMAPAIVLCFGGLMQSLAGLPQINEALNHDLLFFHPAIIMGGLLLALLVNLPPVLRAHYQNGSLVSRLQLHGRLANYVILGGVLMLAGIIFLYLLAENFGLFTAFRS